MNYEEKRYYLYRVDLKEINIERDTRKHRKEIVKLNKKIGKLSSEVADLKVKMIKTTSFIKLKHYENKYISATEKINRYYIFKEVHQDIIKHNKDRFDSLEEIKYKVWRNEI